MTMDWVTKHKVELVLCVSPGIGITSKTILESHNGTNFRHSDYRINKKSIEHFGGQNEKFLIST